jgi:hypothetical protein
MPTVIDALVVELELDSTKYQRSWRDVDSINNAADAKADREQKKRDRAEKERQRREKLGAQQRKKYLDEASGAVANLGRVLATTFLGFESIKGGLNFLGNLNTSQANTARTATQLGITAAALNTYGKAVELAGGKTEDVVQTFGKLRAEFSQFDLSGGEPGPLLQLLQQKGVNYRDAKGNLRDMGTIFDELAEKTKGMDNGTRAYLFAKNGISPGVINRMLEEQSQRDKELATARQMNAATEANAKRAEELATAWAKVDQAVEKSGSGVLDIAAPRFKGLLDVVADYIGTGHVSDASKHELFGPSDASVQARELDARAKHNQAEIDRIKGVPRSVRNNNPGNIKAVGDQPADADGFRIFATLAEGQAAMRGNLERKLSRGMNTIPSLIRGYEGTDSQRFPEATAAYIAAVEKATGKGAGDKLTADDLPALMTAMSRVESGPLPNSAVRLPPSGATPTASGGSVSGKIDRSGGAGDTHVTIGTQVINAPSADPKAVADQVGDATARKVSVSQANSGQQ